MKSEASKGWQTEFKSETAESGTRYQIWLLICNFLKVEKVVLLFLYSDWQVTLGM